MTVKWRKLFDTVRNDNETAFNHLIEEEGVSLKITDPDGQTVAHIAVKNGNICLLKDLLKKKNFLVTAKDKWDQNIFHIALKKGDLETIKFLIDHCKVRVTDPENRLNGNTPLHIAAEEGHLHIVKYFFEDHHPRCNFNIRNDRGETPLFSAARKPHLDIVEFLVEDAFADPVLLDNQEANILFESAKIGDLSVPKYLLDDVVINLDADWRNLFDETVIFIATKYNHLEFIKYFVEEKGANIEIFNNQAWTPLHEAASKGHLEIVKYLVENTADTERKEMQGKKPVQLATDKEVIKYLKSVESQLRHEGTLKERNRRSIGSSVDLRTPVQEIRDSPWLRRTISSDYVESQNSVTWLQFDNFLALAEFCVRYAMGLRYQYSLPARENMQDRIDPIALNVIDGVVDFEYQLE